MLEFLAAIGLKTQVQDIAPGKCLDLPEAQPELLRSGDLVRSLLARSAPPVVYSENGSYGVVSGTELLTAAAAAGIEQVSCALVSTPLSAGVVAFLRAVGDLYTGVPQHPVLWAQVIWLIFFWTNAQALYAERVQEAPDSPITPPLVFTTAAEDIDGLCAGIERYMLTYFSPPSAYLAPSSRLVVVPWSKCMGLLPNAPSETKRKVLIRLFALIPPDLRAGFRELECSESLLRLLATLPYETMSRVLVVLRGATPERQRNILQQLRLAGVLAAESGPPPPRRAAAPADALPPPHPKKGILPAPTLHAVIRGINEVNRVLQHVPAGTRLTAKQREALWQVSMQLWDLLDPFLDGEGVEAGPALETGQKGPAGGR